MRLGRLAVVVGLVGGLATACGSGGPVGQAAVATVDGHEITRQQVTDLIDAQTAYLEAAVKGAKKLAASAADPATAEAQIKSAKAELASYRDQIAGTGEDTMSSAAAASALTSLIDTEISAAALRKAGGKVTKADRDSIRKELLDQIKTKAGVDSTAGFDALLENEVESRAIQQALQTAVTTPAAERTAQLQKAYDQGLGKTVCVALIATADQESAQAALDRVNGGEDFGAVAAAVSLDTESGAQGGGDTCVVAQALANLFGPEIAEGPVGAIFGPALSSNGTTSAWLVVRVNSVADRSFDDARADLEQAIPEDPATNADAAITAARKAAKVSLDPRYGTWDAATGTVTAPVDPAATTTVAPGAASTIPATADPSAGS